MIKDMIQKAREFAALADKATPGPWSAEIEVSGKFVHRADQEYCDDPNCGCLEAGFVASTESKEDATFIAAAPDMAKLLAEMADELEKLSAFWDWARMVDKMQFLTEQCRPIEEAE